MKGKSRRPKGDEDALTASGTINDANAPPAIVVEDVVVKLTCSSVNSSSDRRDAAADRASSPQEDSYAMPEDSKVSAGNETDPPVEAYYSSDGSASSEGRHDAKGSFEEDEDGDNSSGSRSSGSSGSTDSEDLTGSVAEPPSPQGRTLAFRSTDEEGASPLPSTPLRAGGLAKSAPESADKEEDVQRAQAERAERLAASSAASGGSFPAAATPANASPRMGPQVRRILEALASFDGSLDESAILRQEEVTSGDRGQGTDAIVSDDHDLQRLPRLKNSARSTSASSEASSSKRNQTKKKKPASDYSAPLEDNDQPFSHATDGEMLDISAIISQVDRQSLDDELDQLVRELDEAVGGVLDSSSRGIKLRRRSLRRRGRKGRTAANGKRRKKAAVSPTNESATSDDNSNASSLNDSHDEEDEESVSSDPRAQAFMSMVAAEDWMAKEAYTSDDSVIEVSSCLTFQTEEQVKQGVEEAPADGQNESPAIQALREVWNKCTFSPIFDDKRSTKQEKDSAEGNAKSAIEPAGNAETKESPEEPQFLEFIDSAFFEELWKALLSVQLHDCRPLDLFRSPGGASTLSTTDPLGECSVTSTIPTDAASFEACDSLSICSGRVQSDSIDHSAILAKCLARGGAEGDAAGDAGSSPLAKRKAALLLQQCEKKFPSLYKRIIARLESNAGFKSSDVEQPTSNEVGNPQPSHMDSDEDDSLFSTSKVKAPTSAELANKTPRIRNSGRDNSVPVEIDQSNLIATKPETANVVKTTPGRDPTVQRSILSSFNPGRANLSPSQIDETIPTFASVAALKAIEDENAGQDAFLPSPTDAREYALLTSFNFAAVNIESPPRSEALLRLGQSPFSLESVDHLAQGVVSPLTVDSRVVEEIETEDVEDWNKVVAEEGIEVTEILADLTNGWSKPADGEGRSVTRVKDLRESLQKKVPILIPKSSDVSRSRRVRHSSVPRGIYSGAFSDDVDSRDPFPVVLKHRVLGHAGDHRKASSSRVKPRNLEAFLDRTTSPISRTSASRSLPYSPAERRSPTSFPSLFSKDFVGEGGNTEETTRGDAFANSSAFGRDACPDDSALIVESAVLRPSLSRSFTLPTTSRPPWTTLDTPPSGSLNDSFASADKGQLSQGGEALASILGGQKDDFNSQWVAFPPPPRGTFRSEADEEVAPILPTPDPDPFGTVTLKGTGRPQVRRATAERSRSSGRAPRESKMRMLARPAPPNTPKPRFRRLVSPGRAGKPANH